MEQQRIADLEQQLHYAESAALAAERRAAQLGAGQREAHLKSIGKPASFDGQASEFRNCRFQFTAYCGAMDADMRREMEEASKGEVPILTGSMRQGAGDRSRQLYHVHVLSCGSDGGHGERAWW